MRNANDCSRVKLGLLCGKDSSEKPTERDERGLEADRFRKVGKSERGLKY